jgi:hypothetical protein
VVVPIEVNLEIHQPGVEFVSENILEAKLGEEPWQVKLANFCRPCVRWKGRCCTLDFNGFVRAGICAIETQMAKEKKNG